MHKKQTSIGLPAGIITTFDNGCSGYEPLKNVTFSAQIENEFNPRLAEWSINACTYAYQDLCNENNIIYPPEIHNGKMLYWFNKPGFFTNKKISSGYIGQIKEIKGDPTNRIAIIFRGTQKDNEWALDADFQQTQLIMEPSGELVSIHKGFWEIANNPIEKGLPSLLDQIHNNLPNFLSDSAPNELHIGAHSMGSAVALLVFIDLILRNPNIKVNAYLTGCPRVGNPAFSDSLNALAKNPNYNFSLWRIANTEDIITTLPPPMIEKFLYSHVPITNPKDPSKIDLISFTKNLGKVFDNHHLFNYYYAMKKLADE